MNRLTQKQETFVQNLFKGMTQREAWIQAGYSSNYPLAMIDSHACRLANKGKIKARYIELALRTEDESVATVIERKQKLTEIMKGNLLDYQEVGADGGYLSIDRDSPNTGAISEITSRTEYDKDGSNAALVTKVKLHNPVSAIDLLNKMERIYEPDGTTNIVNQILNINVVSESARKATERIVEGERTE